MAKPSCYDQVGLKKGTWTAEEDQKLLAYVQEHGQGSWRSLPAKAGLQRCGKSCRLRWINYLRPNIKRGKFSFQEEQIIIRLHALLGNRWSTIATHLPNRTDNEVKNHWNTRIKKRLAKMGIDPVTHKPKTDGLAFRGGCSKGSTTANLSHMAQWESTRLEAEARLARESKLVYSNIQRRLGSVAPVPAARPQCLDILKAWQGVISGMFAMACHDLESPTSTVPVPIMGVNTAVSVPCQDVWKSFDKTKQMSTESKGRLDDSMELYDMYNMTYPIEGPGTIMEGFSDVFICNFDDQNPSLGRQNSHNEESKNYWNRMANLVNASSSSLPAF